MDYKILAMITREELDTIFLRIMNDEELTPTEEQIVDFIFDVLTQDSQIIDT